MGRITVLLAVGVCRRVLTLEMEHIYSQANIVKIWVVLHMFGYAAIVVEDDVVRLGTTLEAGLFYEVLAL